MITKYQSVRKLNVHPSVRICKFAPNYFYNIGGW